MASCRVLCYLALVGCAVGFAPLPTGRVVSATATARERVVVQKKKGFWEEFDAVVDDFLNKRLGGGEIYYGARQSKFYGDDDRERSNEEFGKYQGKGYSDRRRLEEKLGREAGPSWVGDSLKEGSYWDGTGKNARRAQRLFGQD